MNEDLYDEPLGDNIFFKEIQKNYNDLIVHASEENWIICIPRMETVQNAEITELIILEHILVPDVDLSQKNYMTLTKKYVQIQGSLIVIKNLDEIVNRVYILFKEVFYVKGLKYNVWCIDHPLNRKRRSSNKTIVTLSNVQDCINLLVLEYPRILEIVQSAVDNYIKSNVDLTTYMLDNVEQQLKTLYAECMEQIMENKVLANKLSINMRLLMQIELAVETYMQHCFDKELFYCIINSKSYEDANFNKIVRNVNHLQLKHFQIPFAYYDCITAAKVELTKLNQCYTTFEKINCLKRVFNGLRSKNSNSNSTIKEETTLTTDNLLHILTFLIIKTNVNNWIANLTYLSKFQFNSAANLNSANNFLLTTLEATIEHVKSDILYKNITKPEIESFTALKSSQDNLLEAVKAGNLDEVNELLKHSYKYRELNELCHPLCSCDNCELNEMKYSINSYDNKGRTLLHIASFYGHPPIVDYLLINGIYVDSTDYFESTPLHYAVSRGFQNCTLLLLHSGADINKCDLDGNTPLHLAVNNGHENCVKALIYYSEYNSNLININSRNNLGDTPLHFACKWGYLSIVDILLQYDGETDVKNKRQQSPADVAQNIYVKRKLTEINIINEAPSKCKEYTIIKKCNNTNLPKGASFKKIDRLLKAIEDNDIQLTRFYLGVSTTINNDKTLQLNDACHPLCTCEKCPKNNENLRNYNKDVVNVNKCNVDGYAPIHVASKHGRTEILRLILDYGAKVNKKTYNNSKSALHLACINNKIDAMRELLKCGDCDIDIKDCNGDTPLHDAVHFNNEKIVDILLINGANLNVKNNNGHLPLTIAKGVNNNKIIKMIENYQMYK